jgi:uncharacterized protein
MTVETGTALRRRRRVVATTGLVGVGFLGAGLNAPADSNRFYGLTAATAATYVAGGVASGPIRRGRGSVVLPALLGAAAFGVFYVGALICREIPFLERAIASILHYADRGTDPLVVAVTLANGAAEEVYFRGAVQSAAGGKRPVLTSTAAYVAATTATRNPALVLASGLMGILFALQREATGGIQASTITHLTWSILMLKYLPPLFKTRPAS